MKKLLFTLLICFFNFSLLSQSCLPEGITFTTQAQIDNFQAENPGCTEIEGAVTISGYDITNLNGLSVLTSIGGSLKIGVSPVDGNPLLTNLSGLENLVSIGGDLRIRYNDLLTNISALSNLSYIEYYILIHHNALLSSLIGLENITSAELVGVYNNPMLINLSGFDNLNHVTYDLTIGRNDALTSLTGLNNVETAGALDIWNNPLLENLTALENLISVNYYLWIVELDAITTLSGLENILFVGESIQINDNMNLTSISDLNNMAIESITSLSIFNNPSLTYCELNNICEYLEDPNGSVNIYNNGEGCNSPPELASACGFEISCLPFGNYHFITQHDIDIFKTAYPDCTDLNGNVIIKSADITNFNGLDEVSSIEGGLNIRENENLEHLTGFESLTAIGGNLSISYNSSLINLTGMSNVMSLGGDATILGNDMLSSLTGLENLDSIKGNLRIGDSYLSGGNPSLTSLTGLNNITHIGGYLQIEDNDSLPNLQGLDELTTIEGDLLITYNDQLLDLTGLENLNFIEGSLKIGHIYTYFYNGGNLSLFSLNGLDHPVTIAGNVYITDNTALTYCEVESICMYLENPIDVLIYNNAPGCNSEGEVELACETVTIEEISLLDNILTFPNPFITSTTIKYELKQPEKVTLTIYDYLSKQVYQTQENQAKGKQQLVWNAESYAHGIYYFRLQVGKEVVSGKMVKVE